MTTKQRLLSAALIAITACGGTAVTESTVDEAPTTTATPSTTTTTAPPTTTIPPTTTTTIDPMIAAGAYYEDVVAPGNCLVGHFNAVYDTIADDEGYTNENQWDDIQAQLQPIELRLMQAEVTFIEKLSSYDWPASVQSKVDAVIAEAAERAIAFETGAEASDYQAWAAVETPPHEAAAVLRAALGLPTNIGVDFEDCAPTAEAFTILG